MRLRLRYKGIFGHAKCVGSRMDAKLRVPAARVPRPRTQAGVHESQAHAPSGRHLPDPRNHLPRQIRPRERGRTPTFSIQVGAGGVGMPHDAAREEGLASGREEAPGLHGRLRSADHTPRSGGYDGRTSQGLAGLPQDSRARNPRELSHAVVAGGLGQGLLAGRVGAALGRVPKNLGTEPCHFLPTVSSYQTAKSHNPLQNKDFTTVNFWATMVVAVIMCARIVPPSPPSSSFSFLSPCGFDEKIDFAEQEPFGPARRSMLLRRSPVRYASARDMRHRNHAMGR